MATANTFTSMKPNFKESYSDSPNKSKKFTFTKVFKDLKKPCKHGCLCDTCKLKK